MKNKYQANQCMQVKGAVGFRPLASEPQAVSQGCPDSVSQGSPTSILGSTHPPSYPVSHHLLFQGREPRVQRQPSAEQRPQSTSDIRAAVLSGACAQAAEEQALPALCHGVAFTKYLCVFALQIPFHCRLIALHVLAVTYRVRMTACPSPTSKAGVKQTAQGNGPHTTKSFQSDAPFLDLVIQGMERKEGSVSSKSTF